MKFDHPLSPLRQAATKKGHINKGSKIHFKLKATEPGWFASADSKDSAYVFAFSDHNGTQSLKPSGTWCIGFGYSGSLTDPKDHDRIIGHFKRDMCPDAQVDVYITHDWVNDPYSKGAWACWGPGYATSYLEELQRPEKRIVFASADWADGWRGFVDGAIEQGQQAAQNVCALLESDPKSLRSKL